jgi:hypothetical protein
MGIFSKISVDFAFFNLNGEAKKLGEIKNISQACQAS